MSIFGGFMSAVVGFSLVLNSFALPYNSDKRIVDYVELGVPSMQSFEVDTASRCPWDMILFDNKLYVGGGDYGDDTGPVDIWAYDLTKECWENTGNVPDEEVDRFAVIDGQLIAPGIDPKDDWSLGNYYIKTDNGWETVRTIPNGIHNFDMVEYDGKLFAGIGVISGSYPVVCSEDKGKTFYQIPFERNGGEVDTSKWSVVRVYDFLFLNGDMYVFLPNSDDHTYDAYKYIDGKFVFDNECIKKVFRKSFSHRSMSANYYIDGRLYLTFGILYSTDNMNDFLKIKIFEKGIVYDLCEYKGRLYALYGEANDDGTYNTSVWVKKKGETDEFIKLFEFNYDIPPVSFVCNGKDYYIGMGKIDEENSKNGMILFVDIFK